MKDPVIHEIRTHVNWLVGYVDLMNESNWRDMRLYCERQLTQLKTAISALEVTFPLDEWHEDVGPVLWWSFPIEEPPYAGSPLDSDWPGYHTHWSPIPIPEPPARTAADGQFGVGA